MKCEKMIYKLITVLLLINLFSYLSAQNSYSLKSHSIHIYGTSTIHDWIVNGDNVSAKGLISMEGNQLKEIKSMNFSVEAKDLKSDKKSKGMDEKIYDAMKAKLFPSISFQLIEVISYPNASNDNKLSAKGKFNIAGTSRDENIIVQTKVNSDGTILFNGTKKIQMTDYNIKPPSAMLGTINTGNEVTVKFEIVMQKTN
ncbi:MAG: YceI family protein [Saprospiraceae bacterium]